MATIVEQSQYCSHLNQVFLGLLGSWLDWTEGRDGQTPPFGRSGRSLYIQLNPPIEINGLLYELLKVKGLGYGNLVGEPSPPTDLPFQNPNPHLGILPDGSFDAVLSPPATVGSLSVVGAEREFRNSALLSQNGIPSSIPILWIMLEDQRRGVVVSAVPNGINGDTIFDAPLLLADPKTRQDTLRELVTKGFVDPEAKQFDYFSALRIYATKAGEAVRRFSKAKLIRNYSWCPDNVHLCVSGTSESGGPELVALLSDLDSCPPWEGRNDTQAPFDELRELTSLIYYMMSYLLDPKRINLWKNIDFSRVDPFAAAVKAYFKKDIKESPELEKQIEKISNEVIQQIFFYFAKFQSGDRSWTGVSNPSSVDLTDLSNNGWPLSQVELSHAPQKAIHNAGGRIAFRNLDLTTPINLSVLDAIPLPEHFLKRAGQLHDPNHAESIATKLAAVFTRPQGSRAIISAVLLLALCKIRAMTTQTPKLPPDLTETADRLDSYIRKSEQMTDERGLLKFYNPWHLLTNPNLTIMQATLKVLQGESPSLFQLFDDGFQLN
jgi:hypothetical protein